VVGHERVRAAYPGAEVRHAHPRFTVGEGSGARPRGVGKEHQHAETQWVADRPKAEKQVLSRQREHDAGVGCRPGTGTAPGSFAPVALGTCQSSDGSH